MSPFDPGPLAMQAPNMADLAGQMPNLQPQQGGMFGGGKFGVGQAIVAALNGYLAGRGNPVGMANIKMMQDAMQSKHDNAEYDRRRQQQLQDQMSMYDYKQAHDAPEYGEFERALIASGVQPGTPEWAQAMKQRTDNMLDPIVNTMQGPVLRSMVTNSLHPPSAPVGRLTPIDEGGPTPPASGGFPY